jgi:hypothetical protein
MAKAADEHTDFSEMDNAKVSKEHWKIMFISGMGFFTDAYDLFIIGVVMVLIKPIWHVRQSGRRPGGVYGFTCLRNRGFAVWSGGGYARAQADLWR